MVDFVRQGELTDASSVARRDLARTLPGMAHFAGGGPPGATCVHCAHWQRPAPNQKHICQKFIELTPRGPAKPVPGRTPACKYFEVTVTDGYHYPPACGPDVQS